MTICFCCDRIDPPNILADNNLKRRYAFSYLTMKGILITLFFIAAYIFMIIMNADSTSLLEWIFYIPAIIVVIVIVYFVFNEE